MWLVQLRQLNKWSSSHVGVFMPSLSLAYSHFKIETKTWRMADLKQLMDNEVFRAFSSYATIVLMKMMFMSTATAFQRLTNKVRVQSNLCSLSWVRSLENSSLYFSFTFLNMLSQ